MTASSALSYSGSTSRTSPEERAWTWSKVEILEELDASGGDATRPLWNRALEMVEQGEVEGIAVWNLARF